MSEVRTYRRPLKVNWARWAPDPLPEWCYEYATYEIGPPTYEVEFPLWGRVTAEALDGFREMHFGWKRVE